jgi:LysM repeat protein
MAISSCHRLKALGASSEHPRSTAGPPRFVRTLAVALLLLGLLNGCRTPRELQAALDFSQPGWTVRQGQAVWRSQVQAPEIAGDLLVATHADGRSAIQFMKPPLPIVLAQRAPQGWQIQFFAQNHRYAGPGRPPQRLLWLQFTEALAGRLTTSGCRWSMRPDASWRLENVRTGESLEGFLKTTQRAATHPVQPGDTWAGLANWYGITETSLRAANPGRKNGALEPGQVLQLPP